MKQIHISNAKVGMVLSKPIYDDHSRILVNAGSALTENFLKKLTDMGFTTLCVDTKDTDGIVLNDVVPITIKNKAASAVKNLDIPTVMESAKEIVECICESDDTVFELLNLRNEQNYGYQHAVTVAELSIAMGRLVKDEHGYTLSQDSLIELAVAALLHDIGKRCSDRKVFEQLNIDNDKLEYSEQLAPVFSYNLLKDNSLVSATSRVGILFHKTDENGKSSPIKNMEPDKIHIFAKILHIADTYDTLVSEKNISSADAIEYLMANCDVKFNADLVRSFVNYVPIYPKGSSITLSNGAKAVVYENKPGRMMRPVIKLEDGRIIDLFNYPSITVVDQTVNYEDVSEDVKNK